MRQLILAVCCCALARRFGNQIQSSECTGRLVNHPISSFAAILLLGCLCTPAAALETIWQGPANIASDWFSAANWDTRVPTVQDNAYVRADGIASISTGEAFARNLRISHLTDGRVAQIGGSLTVSEVLSMGSAADEFGQYDLDGGTLNTLASYLGGYGEAYFRHTNGTHNTGPLNLGGYSGTQTEGPNLGVYEISGSAVLNASSVRVGFHGQGRFLMSGGAVDVDEQFHVGQLNRDAQSRLNITAGQLTTGSLVIGNEGWGQVGQNGGVVQVEANMTLGLVNGCFCNPISAYAMSSGTLSVAGIETIGRSSGTAAFAQTGGTHTAGHIIIGEDGASGSFVITGGTLDVNELSIRGPNGRFYVEGAESEIRVVDEFAMTGFLDAERTPRLELVIDSSGLSTIEVDGRASLSGILDVQFGPNAEIQPGTVYEFLTASGGIEGTLALAGRDAEYFQLSIVGNTARVTVLPEPSALVLAATVGGLGIVGRLRRKALAKVRRKSRSTLFSSSNANVRIAPY